MIDETIIGYMEEEEHSDQDTCIMIIWWFRNYHNYLLGGVKFMFSSLLVCRSVSQSLSSPSLWLSPSVPSSLRLPNPHPQPHTCPRPHPRPRPRPRPRKLGSHIVCLIIVINFPQYIVSASSFGNGKMLVSISATNCDETYHIADCASLDLRWQRTIVIIAKCPRASVKQNWQLYFMSWWT